jgi:hypothetical protein
MKFEQQVPNQWGGYQPSDVVSDLCAACAQDAGIKDIRTVGEEGTLAKAQEQRKMSGGRILNAGRHAIESKHSKVDDAKANHYDPDYVKWLEEQADKPLEVGAE